MGKTDISWTEMVWNPTRGCSRVSAGCEHCYAERMAYRFSGPGRPFEGLTRATPQGPRWTGEVRLVPEALDLPFRWRKPRRIFVNSMSDLFHPEIPDEFVARVFAVMAECPRHTFQVLTKRPERMREWFRNYGGHMHAACVPGHLYLVSRGASYLLPNIWLGVSVENQATADERIPLLLETPAAVRFVSVEPILGTIDLRAVPLPDGDSLGDGLFGHGVDAGLDWVIVGAESGPGARPCDVKWIRDVVLQCQAAGVSCFVKQIQVDGKLSKDPTEWPADLRVREMPRRMP